MSRLFLRSPDLQWIGRPLSTGVADLDELLASRRSGLAGASGVAPVLAPFRVGVSTRWALVPGAGSRLHVNGVPLGGLGLRVLEHKDEISLPGIGLAFFSTEEPAVVVPFPDAGRTVFCGRCLDPIDPGTPAVLCPHCRVWHHQLDERECFTYDVCSGCRRPTSLGQELQWTPED